MYNLRTRHIYSLNITRYIELVIIIMLLDALWKIPLPLVLSAGQLPLPAGFLFTVWCSFHFLTIFSAPPELHIRSLLCNFRKVNSLACSQIKLIYIFALFLGWTCTMPMVRWYSYRVVLEGFCFRFIFYMHRTVCMESEPGATDRWSRSIWNLEIRTKTSVYMFACLLCLLCCTGKEGGGLRNSMFASWFSFLLYPPSIFRSFCFFL